MRKREKIYISSLKNTKCHDGSWQVVEVHWKKHKSTRPARADTTKNKCQCQWKHNLCRLYGKYDETINHLLAGCRVLTSNEYLPRDNWGVGTSKGTHRQRINLVQGKIESKKHVRKWKGKIDMGLCISASEQNNEETTIFNTRAERKVYFTLWHCLYSRTQN